MMSDEFINSLCIYAFLSDFVFHIKQMFKQHFILTLGDLLNNVWIKLYNIFNYKPELTGMV